MSKPGRKIECPCCGNVLVVFGELRQNIRYQKCKWCRRWVVITLEWKGNHITGFHAEPDRDWKERVQQDYKDRYAVSIQGLDDW